MIPLPTSLAARAVAAAALVVVGFGAGWTVNGWRTGAETERLRAEHAQEAAGRVSRALETLRDVQAARDALAAQLAALDADRTETLRRLTHENDRLRAGANSGSVRVRVVGAACPGAPVVPEAPARGGVDSGAGAELDAQARQALFDFRADAIRVGVKLDACQRSLRALTGQ
jgi:hypothetical protein